MKKYPPTPRRAPWRLLEVSGPVLREIDAPPGPVPPFAWDACPFAGGWAYAAWDGAGLTALEAGFADRRAAEKAAHAAFGQGASSAFPRPGAATEALRAALAGKTLLLHGAFTPFQLEVFRAVAAIPCGKTTTYGALAATLGRPGAQRAVARALASNRFALVLPCHRVVPAAGGAGGWRWGSALKETLLAAEAEGGPGKLLSQTE
jgi:O-6-methylguanine DNA methyltransferase